MSDDREIRCLFFNLTHMSRGTQFIILSATVFSFHLVQGYMHELIFRLPGFKSYSIYLTLLQFGIYAILAVLETLVKNRCNFNHVIKHRFVKFVKHTLFPIKFEYPSFVFQFHRINMRTYSLIAFLSVATMGLSNTSVAYLNFPTFNMFKSCKLIPVMLGSMLIMGKKKIDISYSIGK
jgi:adenosine 3'-phospho 5'-phosphosulfate transporter B3